MGYFDDIRKWWSYNLHLDIYLSILNVHILCVFKDESQYTSVDI